jgi:hypothetical protein
LISFPFFLLSEFYLKWSLQNGILSFIMALSPTFGHTFLIVAISMVASTLGYLWAFITLSMWGTGPAPTRTPTGLPIPASFGGGQCTYGWGCGNPDIAPQVGLSFNTILFAIPMMHLLVNTKLKGLGLLALLTYSSVSLN